MPEEPNRVLSNAAHSMELFEDLECAVVALRTHPILRAAARQLRERVTRSEKIDQETLDSLVKELEQQLAPLTKLTKLKKIVDALDPHTLTEQEFKKLWRQRPKTIIQDAVVSGRFRERRILLQAKEAETNRKLARTAFVAALVAVLAALITLAVPFIQKALNGPA